uniref:Uncharacterized protein n=1 Tax=Timema douglasi TaxID=61478 RepID=A0A7R8ZEN2_TIMDO|nr:unnamed protein product [Timema douglasi]
MEAGSHFSESGGGEKQQSREVSIKDKIKIEPEMDLDPPEYISVAIKSEIPDSFEPESSCPTLPLKQVSDVIGSMFFLDYSPHDTYPMRRHPCGLIGNDSPRWRSWLTR